MRRLCHPIGVLAVFLVSCPTHPARAQETNPEAAARGVLGRLLPSHADRFVLEVIPGQDGRDVFEIESRDDGIVLRGSSGVAICSALNWYLKYHCHCHISWSGSQMELPDPLPAIPAKVRKVTPYQHRYWFNYCVFSYTLAFWDWTQWEWMIDWMALHGVNMPLAVTGEEATWQAVGRRLGLTDKQISEFLPGPAYLPFGWMGCLDGWGGPLPQSWIDGHLELQRKILARQRELGMTPILQGFTGHVPVALKEKFPQAKFRRLPKWCGFPGTTFVDPQDPLFVEVGKVFVEEQTRQFGTDHYYSSDTFIEMSPPSNDPAFLADMGRAVYAAMKAADPQAVWIMQGWIFHNNPQFWQPPQARALFNAVPDDRLVILEMGGDYWRTTEAYYGKPWLWTFIQDFGDKVSLHGDLPYILHHFGGAATGPQRGRLCGLGMIMEGLGYNPVVYDLVTELAWHERMPDLEPWVMEFVRRRYGRRLPKAENAWRLLLDSVYRCGGSSDEMLCARPAIEPKIPWTTLDPPYDRAVLARATESLLVCADDLGSTDTYQFDVTNVMRQVLSGQFPRMHQQVVDAYRASDRPGLAAAGARLLDLLRDMDRLLAAREEFLLGRWIEDAKRWADSDDERRLYEWNARTQITLWGPRDGILHEYARKQWSGMLVDFYLPRWEMFIKKLDASIASGAAFDQNAFETEMQKWEEAWTHETKAYPTRPSGDVVAIASELWRKYRDRLASSLPG